MESSSSRHAATLASIIDAEKVVSPPRARALLASLANAKSIPAGPATVREWCEAILVDHDGSGAERAKFGSFVAIPVGADAIQRHVDALRAAAVGMLWGRESAKDADGHMRFPRLRKLLVDQWDETRRSCDGADKFLMFLDATLALDRAAEPKAGREGFKTLSLPTMEAAKKDVRVGTIGKPFEAIIDTGKFRKGDRPALSDAASAPRASEDRWATPQVSSIAQPSAPVRAARAAPPARRSMMPVIAGVVAIVVLGVLAFAFIVR